MPALVAIAISALWPGPSLLQAQRAVPQPAAAGEPADENAGIGNFAAPNRDTLQALERAQAALKEHRYGEALEGLNQVLRSSEDYFYRPDRKLPIYKSLKAEARQLLGEMPREGLDLHEVRSGAEARDKLDRAVAAGDAAGLSEISGLWFHTRAGYEASYLLALYYLDHGAPLAGALTLKRLREARAAADLFEPGLSLTQAACYYQAGMPGDCRQVLVDLKRSSGKSALQLAGRETPWFQQEGDAPAWLAKCAGLQRMAAAAEVDEWTMFRGDPSRNASTAGGAPLLSRRWRVPVTDDTALEKALREQQASYGDRGVALFSGLHPLAVGDVILMRTASNVLAVDLRTGHRLWATRSEGDRGKAHPNGPDGMAVMQSAMNQTTQYAQRIWDDAAYGTLSSDGSRVFVIEELPLGASSQYGGFTRGGRSDANRGITNKLAAYDIRTGKLQWELGGREAAGKADTFFLGAPLPLRGQLYAIAEIREEIRLVVLDGATGKLLWSQQLAMVESNIAQDPIRRLAGVSPSFSDGVLVCPTGAGCMVALDLATRSFLWGHIYNQSGEQPATGRYRPRNPIQDAFYSYTAPVPRWLDGTAIIVDGGVLVAPAEADSLFCLNLADGKPRWAAQPRGEHYYVACVHHGVVVLVGRNSIDAVNLEDGRKAWGGRTINMPPGAGVCGRGCRVGGQYFVPLGHHVPMVGGEVLAVDLESGKVLATAKSRPGAVYSSSSAPGNLVWYRGRVISAGLDGLEVYYQVETARREAARRLATDPDDIEGLTLRGELFQDAGKFAAAVADFRRANSLAKKSESHGRSREMLRDALLEALRDDFAANRSMAGEVEPLLNDPGQRATYLRSMATGLQRVGDWRQAVEHYMQLVDLPEAKPALEGVDRSHMVRRDRWVQARLGMLRSEGGAAAAAALDRVLDQRLEEAKKEPGFDGLRRFLAFFGNQPQGVPARAELVQRLTQAKQVLEAELLMAAAVDSTDRKAQATLLADMAALDLRAGRVGAAAACFQELHRQFANVPCHAGMTSSQWLAAFPGGEALRREADRLAGAWPVGEVEARKPEANGNPMSNGFILDMHLGEPSGPFFSDCTVSFENGRQEVCLRDGLGHLQKPVLLAEEGRTPLGIYNPFSTPPRCCGHLLVISTGTTICALDPWNAAGNRPAPSEGGAKDEGILWRQDLFEGTDNIGVVAFKEFRGNPFGPVNARYACFQRLRNLVVVDPLSGEPLWVRKDIALGSEVFGDEQYLFVLPPGSDEASVYRALDGQLLDTRKVHRPKSDPIPHFAPGIDSRLSNSGVDFRGRFVLTWEQARDGVSSTLGPGRGRVLAFFDPWRQKAVWPSRNFAAGALVSMAGGEAVGVLEPGGHFVLVALADGRTIADVQLAVRPNFSVADLVVTRMGDQYIVLVHDDRMLGANPGIHPPQGMFCYPVRRARIYALDLQGKLAWPAPVDVDNQHFLLGHPQRLPVLVFAGTNWRFDPGVGVRATRTFLVAVDRRNGRIVYDKNFPVSARAGWGAGLEIDGDPAKKSVQIATVGAAIRLAFTDKPIQATVHQSTGGK